MVHRREKSEASLLTAVSGPGGYNCFVPGVIAGVPRTIDVCTAYSRRLYNAKPSWGGGWQAVVMVRSVLTERVRY